jgi:hypothetical protein
MYQEPWVGVAWRVPFDDAQLRVGLRSIQIQLSPAEAIAIFDVARIAAAADRVTNVGEMAVLLALARIVYEMAGMTEMPVPRGAADPDQIFAIGGQLVSTGARELAFACAFLVMIHDGELTREEGQLASRLGQVLAIVPVRMNQLAAQMHALVAAARRS